MINSLVSIITPMYDSERFIESAIRSVQAQTYQNWEAIVVDNYSADETIQVVKLIADPRIKFYQIQVITQILPGKFSHFY